MKVVFVASGNKTVGTVSSFVRTQFESLSDEGFEMELFPVVGHGWMSYLKSIISLRKKIRTENPDIIHAHYSVCGIVAYLAALGLRPKVVVSILGSFPKKNFKLIWVRFFIRHLWDKTITKSERTAQQLGLDVDIVPNGVDMGKFEIIDYKAAREMVGFSSDKKYIIWCSHPQRVEKRYSLAQASISLLKESNIELVPIFDKPHDEVVKYMCAADLLLLTSANEGSPNVIKESMACNCPIVTTDVGDVRWVLNGVEGTYVSTSDNPSSICNAITEALKYCKRTEGRKQIYNLGLTTKSVAKKIHKIYDTL